MNVPKLRFKEFNDEYKTLKLSDVAELTSSKRIYLSDYTSNGIPFYRGKEISELKLNKPVSDLLYISNEKYEEMKLKYGVPKENEILITGVGTLGNIYRIPNNNKFYFKDGNLIWLKNIKQNSEYLEYNLEFNKKKLLDSAIGSTQKALTIAGLNKLSFNYPSILEQTKIAKTMKLIDKKIELQSKKIEDLKLFKKGLSNDLINGINEYKEVSLKDIGITYSGLSGKSKEDFESGNSKFVSFMSILKDKIEIDKLPTVMINGNEKQNKVQKYDLFFNTSSETKEEVALCSTINEDVDNLYLNSFCFGYRINDLKLVNNEYLNIMLHCTSYRKLISNLGQGFTRVNISKNELMDLVVKVPSIDVQIKIVDIVNKVKSIIDLEAIKLSKLQELKKGLMQNMFV